MKKHYYVTILSSIIAAALLAGCGSGSNNSTEVGAAEAGSDSEAEQSTSAESSGTKSTQKEDAGNEGENLNAAGFPIVNNSITFTVYGQRDQNQAAWSDMYVFQEYEKKTNIHMDFQEVPADGFAENKQLLFASNDLPDIFLRAWLTKNEVEQYAVTSGQLMPLDDLIDEYAPNLTALFEKYPNMKQSCLASDGHIYAIPAIDTSATGKMDFKQWINTAWLDKLGLEVPTTIDEFKDVLIAIRDGDPNGNGESDEIPLGIREPSSVYALGGSFGLEHQFGDTYNVTEGKVHNWLLDDNFKEYLEYLNDLYEEKLLWKDYYKNDRPSWRSNLSGELFGAMYMPYSDVFLNCEEDYSGYEPLVGPTGEKYWADASTGVTYGCFALSSTCHDPGAAIRWVDYFFSEEGGLFFAFGDEGVQYEMVDGYPVFHDDILNSEEGFMTALGKINMVPGSGFPCLRTDQTDGVVASQKTKDAAALLLPYLPTTYYDKPAVSSEDTDRVVSIEQDLNTYRDEAVTKFIIGEWDFDQWDEYCSTLEQIGIHDLEDIYQKAFDAQQ